MDGSIYTWIGNKLDRVISKVAPGPIYSLTTYKDGYVSGGKFGHIFLWNHQLEIVYKFSIESMCDIKNCFIRSVSIRETKIVVGTADSEVVEFKIDRSNIHWVTRGHKEGELWGLATHPTNNIAATASDDCKVSIWNLDSMVQVQSISIGAQARSCCFSPNDQILAVGTKLGKVVILSSTNLTKIVKIISDRTSSRQCCTFSPSGDLLAVGSNDAKVHIYDVRKDYMLMGIGEKNSAGVIQIDWTLNSQYLSACDIAGERLIYDKEGNHITNNSLWKNLKWASMTRTVGRDVSGIFPKFAQQNDVNAAMLHPTCNVLATGDDFGLVKLLRYPCSKRHSPFKRYKGHCAHVTNVKWTTDGKFLLSTGGSDHALFQWSYRLWENLIFPYWDHIMIRIITY